MEEVINGILIREVEAKNIMTKSSLPVGGYSVNPYVGCTHACKYCYASFMKMCIRDSQCTVHNGPAACKSHCHSCQPARCRAQDVYKRQDLACMMGRETTLARVKAAIEKLNG